MLQIRILLLQLAAFCSLTVATSCSCSPTAASCASFPAAELAIPCALLIAADRRTISTCTSTVSVATPTLIKRVTLAAQPVITTVTLTSTLTTKQTKTGSPTSITTTVTTTTTENPVYTITTTFSTVTATTILASTETAILTSLTTVTASFVSVTTAYSTKVTAAPIRMLRRKAIFPSYCSCFLTATTIVTSSPKAVTRTVTVNAPPSGTSTVSRTTTIQNSIPTLIQGITFLTTSTLHVISASTSTTITTITQLSKITESDTTTTSSTYISTILIPSTTTTTAFATRTGSGYTFVVSSGDPSLVGTFAQVIKGTLGNIIIQLTTYAGDASIFSIRGSSYLYLNGSDLPAGQDIANQANEPIFFTNPMPLSPLSCSIDPTTFILSCTQGPNSVFQLCHLGAESQNQYAVYLRSSDAASDPGCIGPFTLTGTPAGVV